METRLKKLPPRKRHELEQVVAILREEFAHAAASEARDLEAGTGAPAPQLLKIILFGSYARGSAVDESHIPGGYRSDFDILAIVDREDAAQVVPYWEKAEARLLEALIANQMKTPVGLIVHTLDEVNAMLAGGQYFFLDIAKEGILLFDAQGAPPLVKPVPPNWETAYPWAKKYYEHWIGEARRSLNDANLLKEARSFNNAAFLLHRSTEAAYNALLLTLTMYTPKTHNLAHLRNLAEVYDPRLIAAWPRALKRERRLFELLKRAYVEARYSEHYKVTPGELTWLCDRIAHLQTLVAETCLERLTAYSERKH